MRTSTYVIRYTKVGSKNFLFWHDTIWNKVLSLESSTEAARKNRRTYIHPWSDGAQRKRKTEEKKKLFWQHNRLALNIHRIREWNLCMICMLFIFVIIFFRKQLSIQRSLNCEKINIQLDGFRSRTYETRINQSKYGWPTCRSFRRVAVPVFFFFFSFSQHAN